MERNKYHGYNPKKTIEARFLHKKKAPREWNPFTGRFLKHLI